MDDYISKPLRRKDLLAMVDNWVKTIDDYGMRNADNKSLPAIASAQARRVGEIINFKSELAQEDAPMDFEVAIDEFEGDKQLLMEVVDGFLDNVRAQIAAIRFSISDGDAETVRREAHSIKGGAANLSAHKLSSIAFELENIGKSGILEKGIEVLEKFEKEFRRLVGYVKDRY